MTQGRLIVTEAPDGIDVLGIVGLDPALKPLVGTGQMKAATVLSGARAGDQLESAVTRHIRGGTQVIDGYVKFAHPIRITGTAAGKAALAELLRESDGRKGHEKRASQLLFTIESPIHEYLALIASGQLEKAATHPFNEALFKAIDADKWDAGELGFPVNNPGMPANFKIKFANKAAEELFASVLKTAKSRKAASQEEAVHALIKAGAVKSPLTAVVTAVEKDPVNALKTVAAHFVIANKRGNMEKAAALGALLGTAGKFLLRHGGKLLGGAGKMLGRGPGAGAMLRRGGLAMRGAARGGGLLPKIIGGGALGLGGLATAGMPGGGGQPGGAPAGAPGETAGAFYGMPPGDVPGPMSGAFYGMPPGGR